MSDFYNGLQSTATRLLAQFGKPLTLRIQTGAVYDPDTQTNVLTYADHAVSGVIGNYKGRVTESGTLVQTDDKKILVSVGTAPEPTAGAQIIDGATVYVVQTVKALNPAGTPLLYELQGRK